MTEPERSPEDERATLYGFRRNLVVAASAGTGKTYALVGVVVHLALGAARASDGALLDPVPLARVVATTFSRKAAAEIRARLALALTGLASGDPAAAYRADVLGAWARAGLRHDGSELAARARRALEGLPDARVGTLHGFAGTLVRAYGLALGWAPGSTIEDEEDTRDRARAAVSGALEELLREDEPTTRALLRLAGGADLLLEMTTRHLAQLSEDGRSATALTLPEGDAARIEGTLSAFVEHARALVRDPLLGPAAREVVEAWGSEDLGRLEEAAGALTGVAARGRAAECARAFFDFRAELPGGNHTERGQNLVRLFRARGRIVGVASVYARLLARGEAAVRASMIRDSVLGYGQLLCAARDVLATDARAASELSRGVDALLIDEFQDTSRVQREIVELFWQDPERGREAGIPRVGRVRRRGLLVVGDRKQSIYAFRGADVASFAELCIGLAGRTARDALRVPPGRVWEPEEPVADFVALRENRRSAPEILSFVNAYSRLRLVSRGEPAELYEVEYAPPIEDLAPAADTPWGDAGAPRVSWIPVPTGKAVASSGSDEAEVIARRIAGMLASGAPLVRGQPPRPKDIAVLAARNVTLDATAHALSRAGIPYVVAGNGFFAAREVQDMLAMLAFVIDPDDVVARIAVLRGVWCGLHDETLIALTDPHAGVADAPAWHEGARRAYVRASDRPRLDALRDAVLGLRGASATIGPAETLRQASRALDLEETLILLPRGEQRVANVRKLIALAERETDARAFVARVRRAYDEERPEPEAATFSEEDDAVRLLTVHGSKGLDFPIVFVPEAGASTRAAERFAASLSLDGDASRLVIRALDDAGRVHETPSYADAQADASRREGAEWARLAYVASTRAREAMVFVGQRRPPKGPPTPAFLSTTAAALAALAEEARPGAPGPVAIEEPPEEPAPCVPHGELDGAASPPPPLGVPSPPHPSLTASERRDFAVCPRRYQLAWLLELPEPRPPARPAGQPFQLALFEAGRPAPGGQEPSPAAVASDCARARWSSTFPRAPLLTCHAIACGYVALCHPT